MMELVYDIVEISKDKSCIHPVLGSWWASYGGRNRIIQMQIEVMCYERTDISLRSICLNFAQQEIA
jgi:hypothetical protein